MLSLPEHEQSLWRPGAVATAYPRLRRSLSVDVVIVGGGITGLSAAYLLKRAGLRVAVLEKGRIGSGTTGHTTGKVTSQHNFMYQEMVERLGEQVAQLYGSANQTALEHIAELIRREKINCGWTVQDNYVYTNNRRLIEPFKREAATAVKLGLPASFETETPLPFNVRAAVKFHNQASMDAQRYIEGLARIVDGSHSYVFENSHVIAIHDGTPCRVRTLRAKVEAKQIIVATNVPTLPLMARGVYCALEYPHLSYIVACRTALKLKGMYISPDKYNYSILPVSLERQELVLIGGENHIPGLGRAKSRHQKLADYAHHKLEADAVEFRWSARDYSAYDDIPLVGRLYPWSRHMYVATAFKKWGLTNTMVAAMILRDLIAGRKNPWAEVYDSLRPGPMRSIPRAVANELNQ
jgi:glycine/D-amino acid oxidase-like deaminating enzyme